MDEEDKLYSDEEKGNLKKGKKLHKLKKKKGSEEDLGFEGDDEFEGQNESPEEFFQYSDQADENLTKGQKKEKKWIQTLKKHKKTVLIALCLFLLGVVFLVLGVIGTIQKDLSRAIAFFVLCILTLIPGAYQTVYIYRALKGRSGYRFSEIPYSRN